MLPEAATILFNGGFPRKPTRHAKEAESSRYQMVIHLRTPSALRGYDYTNPVRVEPPAEAAAIDQRIGEVWMGHTNFHVIPDAVLFAGWITHTG